MKYFPLILFTLIASIWACTPRVYTVQETGRKVVPIPPYVSEGTFIYQNEGWINDSLDQMPEPLTGQNQYLRTMYGKLNYPPMARENSVQGYVIITVVINEMGQQESAVLKRGIGSGCDEEALLAVQRGGQIGFTPAIKNGKPVKVKYDVPVKFSLH